MPSAMTDLIQFQQIILDRHQGDWKFDPWRSFWSAVWEVIQ